MTSMRGPEWGLYSRVARLLDPPTQRSFVRLVDLGLKRSARVLAALERERARAARLSRQRQQRKQKKVAA